MNVQKTQLDNYVEDFSFACCNSKLDRNTGLT
jgi:hypothetical protein